MLLTSDSYFVKVHFTSVCYFVLYFSMSELCVCHLSKLKYYIDTCKVVSDVGIVSAFEPILIAPYLILTMQYLLLCVVITSRLQKEDASAEIYCGDSLMFIPCHY